MHKRYLSDEEMLEKIFYYMGRLVVEKDFDASILLLTDMGRTLVNAERASFWYRDIKNKQYWTLAALDTGKIVVPQGKGIIGASIENNETIVINNPYEDSRFNSQVDRETGYLTKSILCMPVTNSYGEVIGAYQAINKLGEDGFNAQDEKRLALTAVYSSKALEAQLLRQQNQIDPLTGLKNRRGFYDYYEHQIVQAMKKQEASIIMCDIDFFKMVNDTYGHNAGDAVLEHVAGVMNHYVGDTGAVFRWGGEEFIILLPDSSVEEAVLLANQLRTSIEQSECQFDNMIIKVTMSFGVKQLERNLSPDENVKTVDEKLYCAKQAGRNCVIK